MIENPKVAIIIPTYNNIEDTLKAIRSSIQAEYENIIIIVVDDGSDKNKQLELRKDFNSKFSEVILELAPKNKGFAAACNIGAEIAIDNNANILFFLNNDVVINKDVIEYMIKEFEDEDVAIVGPKIYFARTNIINSIGGYFDKRTLLKKEYGCNVKDNGQFNERKEVEFISGCAFMVCVTIFKKLKGFDEKYFMYTEEIDFCYRTIKKGYKIIINPKAIVWHEHSKTMGRYSLKSLYYLTRNKIYFARRYLNLLNFLKILFDAQTTNLKIAIKKFIKTIFVLYMAIFDGIFNKMGKNENKWLK